MLEIAEYKKSEVYYDLINGRISHGAHYQSEANRRVPTQYYHAESGIGKMLSLPSRPAPRRVGVVGLGAGTLAAHAEPGALFCFYDINPQVVAFADRYFTYLADARARGATIDVAQGDARLSLESN